MKTASSKDQLFLQILSDLSQDIIEDTQRAANETMDLSARLLAKDNHQISEDFRALCASEVSAQNQGVEPITIVQQNMAQVVEKNQAIRAEVGVVLGAMQFSELLRQHLVGLQNSFEVMINAGFSTENEADIAALKKKMQATMHTFDERKAFHEQVLHEAMPVEDSEVTQDLIDQLIG